MLQTSSHQRAIFLINQATRELGLFLQRSQHGVLTFHQVIDHGSYPNSRELLNQLIYTLVNLRKRFPEVQDYLTKRLTLGIVLSYYQN
jgi:hypothetical protein